MNKPVEKVIYNQSQLTAAFIGLFPISVTAVSSRPRENTELYMAQFIQWQ